jgi:hypothetical protein
MNENEPKTSGHNRREHDRNPHTGPVDTGGALPVDDPRAVAKRRREAEEKLEQHQQAAMEQARQTEREEETGPGGA